MKLRYSSFLFKSMRGINVLQGGISTKWCLLLGVLFLGLISCDLGSTDEAEEEDKVLAEVYNKTLYLSDLQGYIPEEATQKDSIQISKAFIEKWVREALLLNEAEKKVSKDLEIDKLVRDYRQSLIISNFEKLYVEEAIDTFVSDEEMNQYYEANQQQYQLEHTILRCRLLKLNNKTITPKDADFMRSNWQSNNKMDLRYINRVCKEFGEICYLNETNWHRLDLIKNIMPEGSINNYIVNNNRDLILRDANFTYYLRVLESISEKEPAPLSFIQEQAKKYILHQRKLKLLEELKVQLYEKETETNNVKIYD
ncbi:MAG: hypothetical protein IPI60_11625 [Saprospiraceae bacterium]|nr:hypothetical protein [Saprospiraceae bacterium]